MITPVTMAIDPSTQTPREIYDSLWNQALPSLQAGEVRIDPHLEHQADDSRRGLTLIIRPGPEVLQRVTPFLDDVRALEPDQHFYQPDECHVTVLAVFSIVEAYAVSATELTARRDVLAAALPAFPKFTIDFRGITAANDAVMIQGFLQDETLNRLRQTVRTALRVAGLGGELDKRYIRQAAHMTVVRFKNRLRNPVALCELLQCHRTTPFGQVKVTSLELLENDWFMSSAKVRLLQRFPLC